MWHTAVEFLDMRVKKTDATKPTDAKAPLKMAPAAAANKGPYPVRTFMLPLVVLLGHKLEVRRDMMPCVFLNAHLFVIEGRRRRALKRRARAKARVAAVEEGRARVSLLLI
jgi:hypothetical protein